MFDIKTITKKCRDMYPTESLSLLRSYGPWFMAWGAERFTHISRKEFPVSESQHYRIGKALKFWVQGATFTGWVYMTCNGSDLYDVYLVKEDGILYKELKDLYFDEVFEPMNFEIEGVKMR